MKTLVEFSLKALQPHQNMYDTYDGHQYKTIRLHDVILSECVVLNDRDNVLKEGYHRDLVDSGFVCDSQMNHNGDWLYRRDEHYCFTDETKKILDKLFTKERQELTVSIKEANDNARTLASEVSRLQNSIDKATFWQRLKYLFGGIL